MKCHLELTSLNAHLCLSHYRFYLNIECIVTFQKLTEQISTYTMLFNKYIYIATGIHKLFKIKLSMPN